MPPVSNPDQPAGGEVGSEGRATGDRQGSQWKWGLIVTLVAALVTCTGTVIAAAVPELIKDRRERSASSQQTPTPPPATASPIAPTPSSTPGTNSELVWRKVDIGDNRDVTLDAGPTNLEYWVGLTKLVPDITSKADHDKFFDFELSMDSNQVNSATQGDRTGFKLHVSESPGGTADLAGTMIHMEVAPDHPKKCEEAVTNHRALVIPVFIGGHYCIWSDANFIYRLTAKRIDEDKRLVVDLWLGMRGSGSRQPGGSR